VLTVLQAESRKQRVPFDASQRITRHIHSVCSITHHMYSVCGVYMCACHSTCHNTHTYAHTHIHTTHTIYVVYDTWCVVGAAGGEQKAVHGVQHLTTHTHTHYTHCVCGVLWVLQAESGKQCVVIDASFAAGPANVGIQTKATANGKVSGTSAALEYTAGSMILAGMYICVCVCMYVYIYIYVCIYKYARSWARLPHSNTRLAPRFSPVYMCVYVCVYVNISIYICIYIRVYTCIHMYMRKILGTSAALKYTAGSMIPAGICLCVCVCTYVYIYRYRYTYIYKYLCVDIH